MHKAVVVDRDYGSVSLENLASLQAAYKNIGIDLVLAHYQTDDEIVAGCADADAILGTGNPPITRKVLESLPKLKLVQRFGIGVNSVDLEAATEAGVLALFMPGFCVEELAAHASALMLSLLRNTTYYDRHIRAGQWPKAGYFMPRSIGDLTLGLYGFGGSAKPLCEILHRGYGAKVIACDPYISAQVRQDYAYVEFVDFQTLLGSSDIISLHAPLNEQTKHIFGTDAFRAMKKDAMIINVARGGLINEAKLIDALQAGEIRFAGLDVFEQEPIASDNPLLQMDNVALTCHSAFYGEKATSTQLELAVRLVDGVLNRSEIPEQYVANPKVLAKINL